MQIHWVPLCPVTSACHPFHLASLFPSIVICSGSIPVMWLLTIRQPDSRPLFTHHAPLCMVWWKRCNFNLDLHALTNALLYPRLWQASVSGEWVESAGMTQWRMSVSSSISLSQAVARLLPEMLSICKQEKHQASWGAMLACRQTGQGKPLLYESHTDRELI